MDVLRQRIAVLSHGRVEVAKILAWDQENHLVYYLGKIFKTIIAKVPLFYSFLHLFFFY